MNRRRPQRAGGLVMLHAATMPPGLDHALQPAAHRRQHAAAAARQAPFLAGQVNGPGESARGTRRQPFAGPAGQTGQDFNAKAPRTCSVAFPGLTGPREPPRGRTRQRDAQVPWRRFPFRRPSPSQHAGQDEAVPGRTADCRADAAMPRSRPRPIPRARGPPDAAPAPAALPAPARGERTAGACGLRASGPRGAPRAPGFHPRPRGSRREPSTTSSLGSHPPFPL